MAREGRAVVRSRSTVTVVPRALHYQRLVSPGCFLVGEYYTSAAPLQEVVFHYLSTYPIKDVDSTEIDFAILGN